MHIVRSRTPGVIRNAHFNRQNFPYGMQKSVLAREAVQQSIQAHVECCQTSQL